MSLPHSLRVMILFAIALHVQAGSAAELALDRPTLSHLSALKPGELLAIDAFPVGPTHVTSMRFERVEIYSSDAQVYEMTASGPRELPRSTRIFLRGYSADGSARIALSLNVDSSFAEGSGSGPEGAFSLRKNSGKSGNTTLTARPLALPRGFKFDFRCANEGKNMDVRDIGDLATQLHVDNSPTVVEATATHGLRLATVAVDTDSLFMSSLFVNNTPNATNWIASMFNIMNTMYERDLLVRLLIGKTILRTSVATDPYTSFTPGASTAELDIFANQWKLNESGTARTFATLLSGAYPSTPGGCNASGLAWINQYCQKGTAQGMDTVGSYSINQVCSSIDIDPDGDFDARIVGHELGHNFGAWHTHCTNQTTGDAPTGTNTIDMCHSGESYKIGQTTVACYSGATSCPAAGAGTIMSYCNFSDSGCAQGTDNLLQFHPTHITQLDGFIAAAPAGCLNTTDDVFFSGFE